MRANTSRLTQHGVSQSVPARAVAQSRFFDPDENVRLTIVNKVCEACGETIGPMETLLLDLGKRILDKKAAVRSAARANVCALYRKHSTNASLQWIPQKLLQTYGTELSSNQIGELREMECLFDST